MPNLAQLTKQKKRLPEPLEVPELQKQRSTTSSQGAVKEPLSAELIRGGASQSTSQKQQQAAIDSMRAYEAELKKKEAEALRRLRQFKAELIAAQKDLEEKEEEGKKKLAEEEEERRKREGGEKELAGGEALAQTGAAAKQPMGIFGLGRKKKSYLKATAERRPGPSK